MTKRKRPENRSGPGRAATQFKPGQSGNPGGRPKGERRLLTELYGEDGRTLYQRLEAIYGDKKTQPKLKVDIVEFLIERLHGRVQQRVEIDGGASLIDLIAAATAPKAK